MLGYLQPLCFSRKHLEHAFQILVVNQGQSLLIRVKIKNVNLNLSFHMTDISSVHLITFNLYLKTKLVQSFED